MFKNDKPPVSIRTPEPARPGRRRFLCAAGLATLAFAPIAATRAHARDRRSLSFVHTHTSEALTTVYFENGSYQAASLASVNQLLRDFRTGEVRAISPRVLDILYDLHVQVSRDAPPFEVICGYRSPQTNAALRGRSPGVAEHSLHMEGRAIDVRLTGFSTQRLHALALDRQRGGVGYYPSSDFIHLDDGHVRSW
jgi:uncharacterized protein YcbK (DUF882 family)